MRNTSALEDKLFLEIQEGTRKVLEQGVSPVVAFDADGTLWHHDVSHVFFKHYFKDDKNFWDTFYGLQQGSYEEALVWLAKQLEGFSYSEITKKCKSLFNSESIRNIEFTERLIRFFQEEKVEVFVVSGSVEWLVAEACSSLNIPKENVMGMKTRVNNDIVTSETDGHITWREGKRDALLEKTKNRHPFFCAGNTTGDLALISSATHMKLAINKSCPDSTKQLYEAERELVKISKENNWFVLE